MDKRNLQETISNAQKAIKNWPLWMKLAGQEVVDDINHINNENTNEHTKRNK